jgi:sortase B
MKQEVAKEKEKKKKKKSPVLFIAIALMLVSAGALGYFGYDYFLYWQDGRTAQGQTDTVRDMFQEQMNDMSQLIVVAAHTDSAAPEEPAIMTIAFDTSPLDEARELTGNPDIIGFLFVEGTNITNVILQGRDNYFYLHRDMFGNHNVNGSVFMDFRNSPDFTDRNTILYGHNMNNGTMFHNVRYYMQQEFFEAHPYIKVITDDKLFIYEVFSAFSARADMAYRAEFDYIEVSFEDDEEFGDLVEEMMSRSVHYTDITANQDDRILALSTCTNVQRNTRYVVVARLAQMFLIDNEE